jgi:serine/threonine protein kinase
MDPSRPNPSRPVPSARPALDGGSSTAPHSGGFFTASGPAAPREPQPGDMIGPYRLVRELGRGGMAVVYEAEDTELPRRVALKVLLTAGADLQTKARFVREGHAQAKVSHEHVVTIFRVGEADGASYIAMPVLNGTTLAQALLDNPHPPVGEVVRIGAEIAEGLAAAHTAGLIHRDIKPANVWLEAPKWRVKILDFGLARDPQDEGTEITIRGSAVGTPAYMSPEQAAGQEVDHRTDLWSLGVVLYQMSTGRKPFSGESRLNVMAAILTGEPPAPQALVPGLPRALSVLVLRLLAKNPAQRPASAAAVAAELDAIARELTAPKVVVVSLPSAASAPSANPWSDLDSSGTDTGPRAVVKSGTGTRPALPTRRRERTRDEDEDDRDEDDRDRESDRRRRRDRNRDRDEDESEKPRSFKWLWIGGATVLAVALSALVWMAVVAVSPKTKSTEAVEQKEKEKGKEQPRPPKPPENDRAAAETLLPVAALKVRVNDVRQDAEIPPGGTLPAGKITVTQIDFRDNKALDAAFVANTFLPAVSNMKFLAEVRMTRWQMELSAEQVGKLAAMPLSDTLTRLDAPMELTAASAAELKKFRSLTDITLTVADPDDAMFGRLAELPRLELLTFVGLPQSARLTDKGWETIARMPQLSVVTLVRPKAAAGAFRILTERGNGFVAIPALEFQVCDLTDTDLEALSKRSTDVRTLSFRTIGFTDEGVKHLAAVKSLKTLILRQTRVTEDGARALSVARPDLSITWEDKYFGPKKKP